MRPLFVPFHYWIFSLSHLYCRSPPVCLGLPWFPFVLLHFVSCVRFFFFFSISVDTWFAPFERKLFFYEYIIHKSFLDWVFVFFIDIRRFSSWLFHFPIQNYVYQKVFKVFLLVYQLKFFVVNHEKFMNLLLIILKNYLKDEVSLTSNR